KRDRALTGIENDAKLVQPLSAVEPLATLTDKGVSISHLAFCTRSVFRRETAPACARHRWREDTAGGSSASCAACKARPHQEGPCLARTWGVITQAPAGWRRLGLEGPDVARALVRVVRSLVAPLVRLRTQSQRDVINGRAAFEQGHRLGRPAIVGQGAELRVGLQARRACDTPTTGEVVAVVDEGAASDDAVATRVGEDAPADAHRAGDVFQATACVVGDSAVADRHPALPEIEAAAIAA